MGLGDFFKSKKEKAVQRALDSTKDNVSRVKALDLLEEEAGAGDAQALETLLKCFHITVKPDAQEQTITRYDDEAEKKSLIDRLVEMEDRPKVLKALRKELATPPWLTPGRRDGIVWLIELLKDLADAATEDDDEADDMVLKELVLALGSYDPEETYRSHERKVELVKALGRYRDPRASECLVPFLKDVDETVRFASADALATAGDDTLGEPLAEVMLEDESIRVREKAAEVIALLSCSIKGHPRRKEIESTLSKIATVDKQGVVHRRGA